MRQDHDAGKRGYASGTRANALWGKGRRRYGFLLAIAVIAAASGAGAAAQQGSAAPKRGFVPDSLRNAAQDNPNETFDVIVQATDPSQLDAVGNALEATHKSQGKGNGVTRKFGVIPAVAARITGAQLDALASADGVGAVTEDAPVQATEYGNPQIWTDEVGAQWEAPPRKTTYPTIAVIDSGVESRSDFDSRLVRQVDFTSGGTNSSGDGFGHGTLVAGLAAGGAYGYTGIEPRARIISLDVLDDSGNGSVSGVIAACEWIMKYKSKYNIRVANLSINAGSGVGAANDPLDRAVEKLWLNGVVVGAAAGNYAVDGAESGVGFAPANDPFVLTVGASDTGATSSPSDDFAAPWSAWGLTQDGFRKPELAAPGRALNGPVPTSSAMYVQNPERHVADGYMWMSGTSFAAPIVSGAAATVIARHPDWMPDQVKGALMSSVGVPSGYGSAGALGVGVVNLTKAVTA